MKTTDPVEVVIGSNDEAEAGNREGSEAAAARIAMGISQLPMEWMDPMSWRLPSGKALAEFALQAGFLAPLMLGTPKRLKKRKNVDAGVTPMAPGFTRRSAGRGGAGRTGTFPETR